MMMGGDKDGYAVGLMKGFMRWDATGYAKSGSVPYLVTV
jgi:hypothetical protein